MKVNKNHNSFYFFNSSKILFFSTCFLCVLMVVVDLFYSTDPQFRLIPHLLRGAILGVLSICAIEAIFLSFVRFSFTFTLGKLWLVYIFMLALQLLYVTEDLKGVLFEFSKVLILPLGTITFYCWTKEHLLNHKTLIVTVGLMLIIVAIKSMSLSLRSSSIYGELALQPYFMLFCIPIILIGWAKFGKIIWLLTMIAGCAIVLTLKRGATLALATSMVTFYLFYKKCDMSQKNLRIMRISSLVFLFAFCLGLFIRWESVLMRWAPVFSAAVPETSGRDVFYPLILKHWWNGHWLNQIFGFGLFSVPKALESMRYNPIYAHSDWLQLLHDQGIIGVCLFAIIHLSILKMIYRSFKMKHVVTPSLVMGEVIFFLANIYSGCTGNPTAMLCFSMLLGYCGGQIDLAKDTALYRMRL